VARHISAKRSKRKSMLIVCEGENTEPEYLKTLKDALVLGAIVDIQVHGGVGHTDPLGLIKEAEAFAKRRKKEAKDSPTKTEYDSEWVVFDAEQRTDAELREAIHVARRAKVTLIISRPCFEAWYLHHEKLNLPAMTSGRDAEHQLVRVIPEYGKNRSAARIAAEWALKEKRLETALRHARAVEAEVFSDLNFKELPMSQGTAVHCLVEALIGNCTDRPALERLGLKGFDLTVNRAG
jgi:hypothetical protein